MDSTHAMNDVDDVSYSKRKIRLISFSVERSESEKVFL
jgi:hypothetical protein